MARPSEAPDTTSDEAESSSDGSGEPKANKRPEWVERFGNDPGESFPVVSRGGRAYNEESRIRQNKRMIEFWRAHEAGERFVLHVKYIRGAHGVLGYWRLVTEDGQVRLVKLLRSPTRTEEFPFGTNPLFWQLLSDDDLSNIRFGRLTWKDNQPSFRETRPPYDPEGDPFGFEFDSIPDSRTRHFPPILRAYESADERAGGDEKK